MTVSALFGADLRGHITFGGLPLPGATVTIAQDGKTLTTISDSEGLYSFPGVTDGAWKVRVEMLCFVPVEQDATVTSDLPGPDFEMKLMPLDEIRKTAPAPPSPPPQAPPAQVITENQTNDRRNRGKKVTPNASAPAGQTAFQRTDVNAGAGANAASPAAPGDAFSAQTPNELSERASDGFLVNGSTINGAASPFAQNAAFGNNRRGAGSLYNGGVGFVFDNSALDAKQYSLTGLDTPKPDYNHVGFLGSVGGPVRLPHIHFQQPMMFFVAYQWTHSRNDTTQSALVPTSAERMGILPNGTTIAPSLISPQAQALLNLYPMPNVAANPYYNYQTALLGLTGQNSFQMRLNKNLGTKNQIYGGFAFQSNDTTSPNIFQFIDKTRTFGLNTTVYWQHRFSQRFFSNFGLQYSRSSATVTPYWAYRENLSAKAGIYGNDQSPISWGPPALTFSSGIQSLSDANPSANHNQTTGVSNMTYWYRSPHTFTFGGDFKRLEFNSVTQQNPRGTFTFTGAAAGSDFADFLTGVPDTVQIAYGNADKYFRTNSMDAFINDDWRIGPGLTVNVGLRWEYSSPITELFGRLVNLDVAPGYTAVAPVLASNPVGPLTGIHYPDSLLRPDRHEFQPRAAFSWRPFAASSMIVRGGYGVYYNTSVYQAIATQMAQQPPLSKTFSVQNTPAQALTLANAFNLVTPLGTNTFAVDPNFKVGYAQNWQLSVQRDLPGGMVLVATYLGIKGTRAPQEFLPNTYPVGAANPCPACPSGFIYMTSNGNSTREAGQIQLRRRLHAGLTAMLQYTYAKALDDAALGGQGPVTPGGQGQTSPGGQGQTSPGGQGQTSPGGQGQASPGAQGQATPVIAQNWLDLRAEKALSNFDQRHLLSFTWQYSTGQGLHGGALMNGWRGRLFKEWTFTNQITAGSGLPETPSYLAAVEGTGVTGPLRPEYTGAPLYRGPSGFFLNPAAFTTPPPGQWGNAGRDIIAGPAQFSFSASMARTFRLSDRFNLDLRFDSTNAINHVTFTGWNTVINSPQFGLPVSPANAMRDISTTLRLRF